MDKEKLTAILDSHNKWLNDEDGKCADLLNADLFNADLSGADLSSAYLNSAYLNSANLRNADLSGADLRNTDLNSANLIYANLSGAKGIKTASEFLAKLETDEFGYVVYKKIGDTDYDAPKHWTITPGSFLTEVVNPIPTVDCACGVNFGTREWCDKNYKDADLWRCRIRFEDLADVVIPYHSDGKARCARLELIEKL
jgi:uncharacterized protein YjbI with pentapeptide repeats